MDYFHKFLNQARSYLAGILLLSYLVLLGAGWALQSLGNFSAGATFGILAILSLALSAAIAAISIDLIGRPIKAIWQTIVHLSPNEHGTPPPNPDTLRLGREMVTNLAAQVYELASVTSRVDGNKAGPSGNFILSNLPLPLVILDKNQNIIYANEAFADYLNMVGRNLSGQNFYSVLNTSFTSDQTFDAWLDNAKRSAATATKSWERVKTVLGDNSVRFFDLAAYYNKDNPENIETIIALFDHTNQYAQDEQAISFVALSVHELRTPLTLLRGYVEVFEEELAGKLDPELNDFMLKMSASAQQLAAFVNNILNVARIDDDQMVLQLQEQDWSAVVNSAVANMSIRAVVRGITVDCKIPANLPKVGVDRFSIYEVISNLVDNAIKYSGKSKKILITARLNEEGMVETSVQDYGVGIPVSLVPNLFNKFYRSHRNRSQIGGTGLGLYLSKAIIIAHGGNIWVRSKEGEGSTFSFTVLPFDKLAEAQKTGHNNEIVREAHGWIKNHSLYRR